MFQLNDECTEATGTVLRFCDDKCRTLYSQSVEGHWNHGTDTTYVPGEVCTSCDKPLTDDMFRQPEIPVDALVDGETLKYLNEMWGPGIVNARDIDADTAQELLANAQDDVGADEHLCDKQAFNAYAALHGLKPWSEITEAEFRLHREKGTT